MKNIIAAFIFMVLAPYSLSVAFADQSISHSGSLSNSFSSWGTPSLQGDWQIVELNGGKFLKLADNFKAKEGPDVKIFLSPLNVDQIDGENASTDSVFVTLITQFKGETLIEIPDEVDLGDYQSLVFHCEAYSKLWGVAALQ